MLTPTHLAMVLDYEAGGSVAEFVAQQVGQRIQQAGWHCAGGGARWSNPARLAAEARVRLSDPLAVTIALQAM